MADELTVASRNFYERARFKMAMSIVYATCAMFFLAQCAASGAQSESFKQLKQQNYIVNLLTDDYISTAFGAQKDGYGFACFCHFSAFVLAIAAAFVISPVVQQCGNNTEARVLKAPQEV